jgi:putative DNA primase/helicase
MTEVDDLRKQVQDRVDQEAAQAIPPEEPQKITSQLIHDCLFANELGDGTLYATLLRDQYVYCKNIEEWYEWGGHYWQRDAMHRSLVAVEKIAALYLAEYKRLACDIAERVAGGSDQEAPEIKKRRSTQANLLKRVSQLRADRRRTSCLKFAHTIENPLAIKGEEFDMQPWLYPCKNGVIDLQTGRLKPGRPGDYLSLSSPIEFLGCDAPAPLWEKSLLEIFNGNADIPAYLQRLFGYSMTGLVKEKLFPVLYGRTGWNGRSMIIETISHVMGDLAHSIPAEMLLSQKFAKSSSGPSPDIMSLKGIRLAFASEIDEGQRFSTSKIKWLTGNDSLVGRGLQEKHPTNFIPTHKLILMTNTQPTAPAHDKAFWERLHLIPFDVSFVNRDPLESHERRANLNLGGEILKEASGILAWLVRGCLLWQREGLKPPLAVTEASSKYQRNEDMMGDFIDECCLREPGAKVQAVVIYNRFLDWYHENIGKGDKLTGTWFGKQLGHSFEKIKSNGCVFYVGIDVKPKQGELEAF